MRFYRVRQHRQPSGYGPPGVHARCALLVRLFSAMKIVLSILGIVGLLFVAGCATNASVGTKHHHGSAGAALR
jgi:hypothetical protein